MHYLETMYGRCAEEMKRRYKLRKQPDLEKLEASFSRARSEGKFTRDNLRHLSTKEENEIWDPSVFSFPRLDPLHLEGLKLHEMPKALENPDDIKKTAAYIETKLRPILTSIENIALLLRFVHPDAFAMFSDYPLYGFFPITFDSNSSTATYLNFCRDLKEFGASHKLKGRLSQPAYVDHALWTLFRTKDEYCWGCYVKDEWVNKRRMFQVGIKELLKFQHLDDTAPIRRRTHKQTICLAELLITVDPRLAGKLLSDVLEDIVTSVAAKAKKSKPDEVISSKDKLWGFGPSHYTKDNKSFRFYDFSFSWKARWSLLAEISRNYGVLWQTRNVCAHPFWDKGAELTPSALKERVHSLLKITRTLANRY